MDAAPDLVAAPRRLKLTVSYDGTAFHGWQHQPGLRTVQGVLVQALEGLVGSGVGVEGASRTDRGVHARGQVAHWCTESPVPIERLARVVNGRLPLDVRVRCAEEAPASFHARFSAVGKHYRYLLDRHEVPEVFLARRALHYPGALDLDRMREAAAALVGEHDFAAFKCRSRDARQQDGRKRGSTTRRLFHVGVKERDGVLVLDFWGSGFLYKMVRTLAGSLLEVGRRRWTVQRLRHGLLSRQRSQTGPTLAPRGLCLEAVYYDPAELDRDLEEGDDPKSAPYKDVRN